MPIIDFYTPTVDFDISSSRLNLSQVENNLCSVSINMSSVKPNGAYVKAVHAIFTLTFHPSMLTYGSATSTSHKLRLTEEYVGHKPPTLRGTSLWLTLTGHMLICTFHLLNSTYHSSILTLHLLTSTTALRIFATY